MNNNNNNNSVFYSKRPKDLLVKMIPNTNLGSKEGPLIWIPLKISRISSSAWVIIKNIKNEKGMSSLKFKWKKVQLNLPIVKMDQPTWSKQLLYSSHRPLQVHLISSSLPQVNHYFYSRMKRRTRKIFFT